MSWNCKEFYTALRSMTGRGYFRNTNVFESLLDLPSSSLQTFPHSKPHSFIIWHHLWHSSFRMDNSTSITWKTISRILKSNAAAVSCSIQAAFICHANKPVIQSFFNWEPMRRQSPDYDDYRHCCCSDDVLCHGDLNRMLTSSPSCMIAFAI